MKVLRNMKFSNWNKLLGIDFGSSRIRIWSSDEPNRIIDQPACIAVDSRNEKVLAVGSEAQTMEGRVSSYITIVYPVQNGIVYDAAAATALLKLLIRQSFPQQFVLSSPSAMVVVPASATDVEKQTYVNVVSGIGVREVLTIAQPLAASIGAGVPIADSSGSFIMQLGAGVAEVAVISLGSIVNYKSTIVAGDSISEKVQYLLKENASLEISKETAAKVLSTVISLQPQSSRHQLIAGQYLQSGSPTELDVNATFFKQSITQTVQLYQKLVQKLLSTIPPELTVDSIDKGLLLSGGLAKMHGLDDYFVAHLGIPVSIVDNPHQTAIRGVMTALQHLDLFKESLGYLE